MHENWENELEKGDSVCSLFMDLLKAFDTVNHDLLQAKFKQYGFLKDALIHMYGYLKNLSKDL